MGRRKRPRVMVLIDLGEAPPKEQDFTELIQTEDWKGEQNLLRVLKALGLDPYLFAVYDDVVPLIQELKNNPPELIFNLCEGFRYNRDLEPHVAAVIELMGIKFTGSSATALALCKDKGLTKKILNYHRISTPAFAVSRKSSPLRALKRFKYPVIIKPLGLEASEGISLLSLADNEKDAIERVTFLHEKYGGDVIVEEYIEGREIYVGVLGNERTLALPPRELFFKEVPDDQPKFATYSAKWDTRYRKRWGIRSGDAEPIDSKTLKRIQEMCRKIHRLFGIRGYSRIDLRVRANGSVYFIEANPNPALGNDEDFAEAAKRAGISYTGLIRRILRHAQK